jgi:hypothetical protein
MRTRARISILAGAVAPRPMGLPTIVASKNFSGAVSPQASGWRGEFGRRSARRGWGRIRAANRIQLRAVLAAVKTALRRLWRWPAANLDHLCARRGGVR